MSLLLHPPKLGLMTRLLLACVVLLVFPYSSFADFSGRVVSVLDGDTIEVLHNLRPERIRLSGIDCPEKGQGYGNRAKQATSALVFGKEVMLLTHGLDKNRHTLADVILPDGTNVNHALVKAGWCWWYRKYAPENRELERLEKHAREAKQGLWINPAHVPPWQWRKRTR
jgi:endonuclease YncB( thermonuclease family)